MNPRTRRISLLVIGTIVGLACYLGWRQKPKSYAESPSVAGAAGWNGRPAHRPTKERSRAESVIRGQVVEEEGTPVLGAVVCLRGTDSEQRVPVCRRVDDAGEFQIPTDREQQVVSASALGFTTGIAIAESSSAVVLRLRRGGVVVDGIVVDAWGGAIEDATVSSDLTGLAPSTVLADAEGGFSLTVSRGSHSLEVRAPGYAPSARRISAPYQGLHIQLLPESTVFGHVQMASTEEPVVDALLSVNGESTGVRTDDSGGFSLGGMPPGPVVVTASSGGALAISDELVLEIACNRGPLVLQAYPAASIVAALGEESTRACDAGELFLKSEASNELHVLAVQGTRVSASGLVPGRYSVSAECPGGPAALALGTIELKVGPNEARWSVPRGGLVRGRVVTAAGEGVPDARVAARVDPDAVSEGHSEEDGSFELFGLPPGTATVRAYSATGRKSEAVEIIVGEDSARVRVTLPPESTIEGHVLDEEGTGIADVDVRALLGGTKAMATSACDGSFSLEGLSAGEYEVSSLQMDASATVHVEEGARVEVDLVVPRSNGSISGTVVGPDGAVVQDAYVYATPSRSFNENSPWPVRGSERWRLCDENGRFSLEELGSDTYVIQAETKSGFRGTVNGVSVATEDVTVRLAEDGRIAGRVEGLDADPPRFSVTVSPLPTGTSREQTVLDKHGEWSMEGLPEGRYEIHVRAGSSGAYVNPFDLTSGESKTEIVVALKESESLRGRVVDVLSGNPIPGVRILPESGGDSWGATWGETPNVTNSEGAYTVTAPPAGLKATVMAPSGYQTVGRALTSGEGGALSDIVLAPIRAERGVQRGSLGLKLQQQSADGETRWTVSSVIPGGPAQVAGVEVGMVLQTVDRVDVRKYPADICRTLLEASVGQSRVVGFTDGTVVALAAE